MLVQPGVSRQRLAAPVFTDDRSTLLPRLTPRSRTCGYEAPRAELNPGALHTRKPRLLGPLPALEQFVREQAVEELNGDRAFSDG